MAASAGSTPAGHLMAGVSGEFHLQGNLLLAARTARRRGLPPDRMWLVGAAAEDRQGAPIGFVLPVSFVRELSLAGAVVGLLIGLLTAFTLDAPGLSAALPRLAPTVVGAVLLGAVGGLLAGWAAVSARVGAYLRAATAGALLLKIGIPDDLPETERERLAETAERVLREAKAEAIHQMDGTVEVNSPQSPEYLA